MIILFFAILIAMFAALCVIYEKAGEPGWAAIIPIYNVIVWMRIIKKPWWWLLLIIIPLVGLIFSIWATNLLMKKFVNVELWTVGAIFLLFIIFLNFIFMIVIYLNSLYGSTFVAKCKLS